MLYLPILYEVLDQITGGIQQGLCNSKSVSSDGKGPWHGVTSNEIHVTSEDLIGNGKCEDACRGVCDWEQVVVGGGG